jgi:hypothetical protein
VLRLAGSNIIFPWSVVDALYMYIGHEIVELLKRVSIITLPKLSFKDVILQNNKINAKIGINQNSLCPYILYSYTRHKLSK